MRAHWPVALLSITLGPSWPNSRWSQTHIQFAKLLLMNIWKKFRKRKMAVVSCCQNGIWKKCKQLGQHANCHKTEIKMAFGRNVQNASGCCFLLKLISFSKTVSWKLTKLNLCKIEDYGSPKHRGIEALKCLAKWSNDWMHQDQSGIHARFIWGFKHCSTSKRIPQISFNENISQVTNNSLAFWKNTWLTTIGKADVQTLQRMCGCQFQAI